jgi:hypothetical protein
VGAGVDERLAAVTPEEFLAEAERRLAANTYKVERTTLRGVPAVVGRRKPFRVRWFLTQLKTSVVVCAVPEVTQQGWLEFVGEATTIARAFPGGLPNGLQSGYGAVPVLAATTVDPAAAAIAQGSKPPVEWFGGVCTPGLADLTQRQVYAFGGKQVVGAVYFPFLRKQRDLVTSIVR